jgi:hypothetical protein
MGSFLFASTMVWRDLAGPTGPFRRRITLENSEFGGRFVPKKEARPMDRATPELVAAQYIQKTSKNNGLFDPFCGLVNAIFGEPACPSAMALGRILIAVPVIVAHDLRANATRLSRGIMR